MENNKRWEHTTLDMIDMMNAVLENLKQSEQEKKEFLEEIKKKIDEDCNNHEKISDVVYLNKEPHLGYYCSCGIRLSEKNEIFRYKYCYHCGSKLNWINKSTYKNLLNDMRKN